MLFRTSPFWKHLLSSNFPNNWLIFIILVTNTLRTTANYSIFLFYLLFSVKNAQNWQLEVLLHRSWACQYVILEFCTIELQKLHKSFWVLFSYNIQLKRLVVRRNLYFFIYLIFAYFKLVTGLWFKETSHVCVYIWTFSNKFSFT
jgi:hypothetical protein